MSESSLVSSATESGRSRNTNRGHADVYQFETLRPIVCLAFVSPFLLIYEMGVIFCGNQAVRNGVDVGLQWLLGLIGMGQILLLPLLTVTVLILMHHARNDRCAFHPSTLTGMTLESMGLGLILLFAAKGYQLWFQQLSHDFSLQIAVDGTMTGWEPMISSCGAGLYEELAFRLMLLTGMTLAFCRIGVNKISATIVSVGCTSLLFAAAHYNLVNPAGSCFELSTFAVRTVASLFFCVVFLFRGFGIAVGTHIAYDVLAQLT